MKKQTLYSVTYGIVIFLAIVAVFITIQVFQMKPNYEGRTELSGLNYPVLVNWDSSGVIHIEGKTADDVIFASGFVAAKERLWQMELQRRLAKGQLSEIFGDTTVNIDKLFLTIGIDSLTRSLYGNVSGKTRSWLKFYSEGINAYLEQSNSQLPIEFRLLRFEPEKWQPQDCLLQNRVMAWYLNFNWRADLLFWRLRQNLPKKLFDEIYPQWKDYPDIVRENNFGAFFDGLWKVDRQIQKIMGLSASYSGSNSWVVAPFRTKSGYTMLANDPHLGLQIPSVWLEMHLKAPEINVAGFAFPGAPGIIIGRNEQIAWGVTNGMIDDCDYFIEEVDKVQKTYKRDGIDMPLIIRQHYIKIKEQPDIYFTFYRTENGPIVNHLFPNEKKMSSLSLKWTGYEQSDELLTFIELANAGNWDEFVHSLKHFAVPAQNFVYADKKGNIGYRLAGKIPVRTYSGGLIPVSGETPDNRWKNWIPFGKMPELFNPESGVIITANNRIIKDYPYYLSELWEPPCRANRISKLIKSAEKTDRSVMQMVQFDTYNPLAEKVLSLVLTDLQQSSGNDIMYDNAVHLLRHWNYSMTEDEIAAAIYEVFQYMLIQNIFQDEMRDLFKLFVNLPNFYLRMFIQIIEKKYSPWYDDTETSGIENRTIIVQKSFHSAIDYLKSAISSDMEDWKWGRIHKLELKHSLGQVPLTRTLFNAGPFSASGAGSTINVGTYDYRKSFDMIAGASMRFIVDWSMDRYYWSILPGGNSGNFLSPFYKNQVEAWRNGDLKRVGIRINYYNKEFLLDLKGE